MNKLLIINFNVICLVSLLAAMQNCIAAPHKHKEAGLPTFCNSQNIGSNPDCGKTPTAGFDKQGKLWVVYVDKKYIKLVSSTDLAASFTKGIAINPLPEKIYADGENRPKIAFGQNQEIYISWVNKTEGSYTGDIRFSRSIDNGKTFSIPITVNDDKLLTSHRFDTLAVSPDGKIHLTWLDKRDLVAAKKSGKKYTGAALYHAVSVDNGLTFSKNNKIADNSCECCRISIDFTNNGSAVALWRHIFEGMTRDHAMVNLDSAERKPEISRVTFDNWQIEACPHHGPDMSIGQNDELHLAWFTGLPDRGGLFYGRYNQDTKKLENQFNVDSSATASRPQILTRNNQVFYVWKVLEQEKTKLQIRISEDNGNNWSETVTLSSTESASDYPLLFSNQNKIYISWWTESGGFQLFPVANGNEDQLIKPFNKKSLSEIEKQNSNSDFLLVLWSVDCPPCFQEFKFLSSYVEQKNSLKLILVSTDNDESLPEIKTMLKNYNLEEQENWYFNGVSELLRSKIDSKWYGELPRTYFYKNNGEKLTHSGPLNQDILDNWQKQ